MQISLTDFFRIGRNAVQLYPAKPTTPCLQPQAFRVLQQERGSEVGTPNLGAVPTDKDTPFFWSRKWHNSKYNPNALAFEYPIVTMFEVIGEATNSPFSPGFTRCYQIEISVLDVYAEDCVDGSKIGCKARPINQIYVDTGIILDSILQYYGKSVVATTSLDATERIYYRPWLDAQIGLTYRTVYDFANMFGAQNKSMFFSRVERPTQKIYGTKTVVKFCTMNCPVITFDETLPDFGLLAFEAGCKNC
jgi:hypothetical protein